MRAFIRPLVALPVALTALTGLASAQMSADQIINSLKPNGNPIPGATRGIKLGGTTPAPAPSPARPASTTSTTTTTTKPVANRPVTQTPPPAQVSGPSVNVTVNFPTGSAELTPAARASLDNLGRALASHDLATFHFQIVGHTDNVGSREENQALSQRRADAVVSYLTGQYKVDPSRLQSVGKGEDDPLVQTPPQTPEARNRRVQVINLGA